MCIWHYTVMRRLTMGICSEKCIVRHFCHHANVIECTYTNLETWYWLGLLMDEKSFQTSFSTIGRFHPHWRFTLAGNFPPQSAYLEFPKILNTVVYAVRRWPKRHYAARDRTWNCMLLMKTLSQCVKWRSILCICRQSSRCLQLQSKHPATNYWVAETILGRKSGKISNNETWTNSFIELSSKWYQVSTAVVLNCWAAHFCKFARSLRIM
jgi:hypothetical protein